MASKLAVIVDAVVGDSASASASTLGRIASRIFDVDNFGVFAVEIESDGVRAVDGFPTGIAFTRSTVDDVAGTSKTFSAAMPDEVVDDDVEVV